MFMIRKIREDRHNLKWPCSGEPLSNFILKKKLQQLKTKQLRLQMYDILKMTHRPMTLWHWLDCEIKKVGGE